MAANLQRKTLEIPDEPDLQAGLPEEIGPALRRLRAVLPEGFQRQVRSARALSRELREAREEKEFFATTVPALDRLLDGGLPRGQLVELVGSRTSGRFSTVLATLAASTSIGEAAVLVDLGDGLDPAAAAALGVDLRRLLWLRPIDLKQALAAAEMVLATGFPLVAVDLGMPPIRGGRGLEAAWLRLARAARAHGAALLISAPYRVSGTAAGAVLKAERARAAWQGENGLSQILSGASSRLQLEKHRGRLPGEAEEMRLALEEVPSPHPLAPSPTSPTPSLGRGGDTQKGFVSGMGGGAPLPGRGLGRRERGRG